MTVKGYEETKENINKNYPDLDHRAKEFICHVIDQLNDSNKPITDYICIVLDLLVVQLMIYYKTVDNVTMQTEKQGVMLRTDAYEMLKATTKIILDFLEKLNLSPMADAKIKRIKTKTGTDKETAAAMLKKLTE